MNATLGSGVAVFNQSQLSPVQTVLTNKVLSQEKQLTGKMSSSVTKVPCY